MGNKEQIKKMQEDIYELYEFIDQLRQIVASLHESDAKHTDILTTVAEALEHINEKFERWNTINVLQTTIIGKFEERIEALEEKIKE